MENEEIKDSSYADSQEIQTNDLETKDKISSIELKDSETPETKINKHFYEDEPNQDLHNEILEKLDIVRKKEETRIKNEPKQENLAEKAYLNDTNSKKQLETMLKQDFDKIQKLLNNGLINSTQGQNLKKEVLKKAFDKLVQTEKIKRSLFPALEKSGTMNSFQNKIHGIDEFSTSNPDFFTPEGRKEVLNYLKSGNVSLGKDDVSKISEIIRAVEKSAIDRYLQKIAHEKTLKNSNESAKQKLKANAQKTGFNGNFSRTFTREQIGKMSSAEFVKYESVIMEQLKKGLIR